MRFILKYGSANVVIGTVSWKIIIFALTAEKQLHNMKKQPLSYLKNIKRNQAEYRAILKKRAEVVQARITKSLKRNPL